MKKHLIDQHSLIHDNNFDEKLLQNICNKYKKLNSEEAKQKADEIKGECIRLYNCVCDFDSNHDIPISKRKKFQKEIEKRINKILKSLKILEIY